MRGYKRWIRGFVVSALARLFVESIDEDLRARFGDNSLFFGELNFSIQRFHYCLAEADSRLLYYLDFRS